MELVPRTRLQPDTRHLFRVADPATPVTHVRLDVFPDGGLARLRVYGDRAAAGPGRRGAAAGSTCCRQQHAVQVLATDGGLSRTEAAGDGGGPAASAAPTGCPEEVVRRLLG